MGETAPASSPHKKPDYERIAGVLLVLASTTLVLSLVSGVGWYWSAHREVTVEQLSAVERQALVQDLIDVSPGTHRWSYFEPRIGYTLNPSEQFDIWDSSFRTNELGFRAPPVEKDPGVYRILFVGDSWTFGMGIDMDESYPLVLQELANSRDAAEAIGQESVQSWTLALPGWSGVSQMAALDYFFDLLAPDAVVFAPSSNDHLTTASVLPNGSTWSGHIEPDHLGTPHNSLFRGGPFASHEFQRRWRQTFELFAASQRRASKLQLPVFFYFVARWQPAVPDYWMKKSGIDVPYGVVHPALTLGQWENPSKVGHGTPAANQHYAEALYELMARSLGWPLPDDRESHEKIRLVFSASDAPPDLERRYRNLLEQRNRDSLLDRVDFPLKHPSAQAGPINGRNGIVGRATSLLLRRKPDTNTVLLETQCLANRPFLYPMELRVTIPSPNGGTSAKLTLASDPCRQIHEVPMPTDVPPADALDLILETGRAADQGTVRQAMSYRLISVDQS